MEQKAEPARAAAPAATAAIPLAEIATQVTEVSNLLHTMMTQLTPSPEIEAIGKQLPAVSQYIDRELAVTMKNLRQQPTLAELQTQQRALAGDPAPDDQLAERAHRACHRASSSAEPPGRPAKDVEKDPRCCTGFKGARADCTADKWGARSYWCSATVPASAARHPARPPKPRSARGGAVWDGTGADCTGPEERGQGDPDAGATSDLEHDLWERLQSGLSPRTRQVAAAYRDDIRQYVGDYSRGMPLHVGLFVVLALALPVRGAAR